MEIKTTKEIVEKGSQLTFNEFCKSGFPEKRWVAIDDIIEELKNSGD